MRRRDRDAQQKSCRGLRAALLASTALVGASCAVIAPAQAQSGPFVYVPNEGDNTVSVVDTSTNLATEGTTSVGSGPWSVAVTGDESVVFVTTPNLPNANAPGTSISAINTLTGAVVGPVFAGPVPISIAVTPNAKTVYVGDSGVPNGSGDTVYPINVATGAAGAAIVVGSDPYGMAVTPNGQTLYVANEGSNNVSVINTTTNTVVTTIAAGIGVGPTSVAVTPNGQTVYVANSVSSTISVINTATNTAGAQIGLGTSTGPKSLIVTPNGQTLYVVDNGTNTVSVINTTTDALINTILLPAGADSLGVAVSPDGTSVYVTNIGNNTVSVINTATNLIVDTIVAGIGNQPAYPGVCSNGNALLASGLTFRANTSGALACTLASGPTGSPGPIFTGGTMLFAGAGISSALPISLQAPGGTFDTDGNNTTLSGAISGPGSLTKSGAGTLTLSGSNTYTGATSVNAGTLQGGAANAFSPFSAFTVASGATLDLNSFNQTIGSLSGAGSVTLGAATLTTGNDGTNTSFPGSMSGTGGLTKIGGGIFVLTGTNTYTGGTTISAGTLQLGNGGTTGSIVDNVTNNSTFVIDLSNSFTFGGVISGTGAFQQMGSGTTVLTGASNYTGATTISGGTLEVDGSIADTSGVTVNSGGTLTGTGTVDPATTTIASGGTLAPGNAANPTGTLTITGNLAFQTNAVYMVQVIPAAASLTNVSGTATLTGATVNAQFAAGSYVAKKYTILTAMGGLGLTTFAGLTNSNLPAGTGDSLSYDADDVYLNLVPGFTTFTGLNINQQNVANALTNFFNSTGGIPASFFGLSPNGLTQIDGEVATDAERGAFQMTDQFLELMLDPFVDGRSGAGWLVGGGMANSFAPDEQAHLPPDIALAYAGVLKAAPPPAAFEQRWSTWGAGFGGNSTANGNAVIGSTNVTARDYGFAAGMDYHVSPDTVMGFALAGGGTNWSLAQNLGSGRSDTFQAGVYGVTRSGPGYVAAALAFANHWMTTDRFALGGDQLTASFVAQSYSGRLEAGYRFAPSLPSPASGGGLGSGLGVTPYAAVQAQNFHTPGYSETDVTGGGFGLTYNAMSATDTRSELGARFDAPVSLGAMPLVLRGRLAWAHDWVSDPALSAVFETLPGANFIVNGAALPKDSALTSAAAVLYITSALSFAAKFDGEFASGSQTYAGTGTLRYQW